MVKKIALTFILGMICILSGAIPEKKFCIIITSYNNSEWCVKNLETVFFQKNNTGDGWYENYRVIVIDDHSDDSNAEYIEKYVNDCNQQHRVRIIKNSQRKRALANLYKAFQLCESDEIIFNYDGDDWLAHDGVFAMINQIYQDPNVWITYGQFINWPTDKLGYCQPLNSEVVEKRLYRKKWWMPGQLRTFYAWLVHQVQLKDLFFDAPYFKGEFFPANADLAIYYPMMEMAGFHYHFISEIIYIRNVATPINDFKANKEVQVLGSKLIREKQPYENLQKPLMHHFDQFKNQKADIIIFATSAHKTQRLLTSIDRLIRNVHSCYVVYPQKDASHYADLKATGLVHSIACTQSASEAIKECCLSTQDSRYCILTDDSCIVTQYLDCAEAIFALEKNFAYSFFFGLDFQSTSSPLTGFKQEIPPLNYIAGNIYAWGFMYAEENQWRRYNNTYFSLYRKKTLADQWASIAADTIPDSLNQWQTVPINLEQVGLCYQTAKVAHLIA